MKARDFRDLRVWNRSMDLAVMCHKIAQRLPREERFGLVSQLCRSAYSIPSNIAEGNYRLHLGDYLRSVSYARGSLGEVFTHLELVARLDYLPRQELGPACEVADHVGRMLTRMVIGLRRSARLSSR